VTPPTPRPNQPSRLKNLTCCYCLNDLKAGKTEEHVIARRFVPKGVLESEWNLILYACQSCNNSKSDLEDDLALLSLQYCPLDSKSPGEVSLIRAKLEKARRAISRRTKQPVSASSEETTIDFVLGPGATMSVELIGAPQFDDARAHRLAMMQASAFFYLLSFNHESNIGSVWPGSAFAPADIAIHTDWGNAIQRWFMSKVANWQPRFVVATAKGFFRAAIRRHPLELLWSCALEWNRGVRVVAFLGSEELIREALADRPSAYGVNDQMSSLRGPVRIREDLPLAAEDDVMFDS
jgi:hypothetical protein